MRWHVLASSLAVGLMLAGSVNAGMIGMNIAGPGADGVVMGSNIGVTGLYQQSNWNNQFTVTGLPTTHYGFVDSNGNSLGTDANGFYAEMWSYGSVELGNAGVPGIVAATDSGPRDGDDKALAGNLYNGYCLLNSNLEHEGALAFHFFNIPYDKFDVVVYTGNSASNMNVRTAVGATEWNIAGTPSNGTITEHGILRGADYQANWQEGSHDGLTGGNYFVINDLTTANNDGHLDLQMYKGVNTEGWGLIFAVQIAEVPEPGPIALLGTALVGLICYAWRRRK